MTIKELAEIAGVSQETIRRTGKKLFPKRFINGVKTELTEKESFELMSNVKTKNDIAPQNVPQNMEVISPIEQTLLKVVEQNTQMMALILSKMDKLENKQPKQLSLPVAPDIEPRAYLNQLVREYSQLKKVDFRTGWSVLYTEFLYRCKTNIKVKAKNEGIKPIDYLERENLLLTGCSIMKSLIDG